MGHFEHSNECFVLEECPYDENLYFDAFWFTHENHPDFCICSRCFEFDIRYHYFEPSFECRVITGNSTTARCLFGVPRMTDLIRPTTIHTGIDKDFINFKTNRPKEPHFSGVSESLVRHLRF
jgi:hypothetical protein